MGAPFGLSVIYIRNQNGQVSIDPWKPKRRGCFNIRNEVFVILLVGNRELFL